MIFNKKFGILKYNPHICSAKQLNMFVMYVERG
jgi:hypothetical protein